MNPTLRKLFDASFISVVIGDAVLILKQLVEFNAKHYAHRIRNSGYLLARCQWISPFASRKKRMHWQFICQCKLMLLLYSMKGKKGKWEFDFSQKICLFTGIV